MHSFSPYFRASQKRKKKEMAEAYIGKTLSRSKYATEISTDN